MSEEVEKKDPETDAAEVAKRRAESEKRRAERRKKLAGIRKRLADRKAARDKAKADAEAKVNGKGADNA